MKIVLSGILVGFVSLAVNSQEQAGGKKLFESKCARCHGKDGAKGVLGAKNLQYSRLTLLQYGEIIRNGKGKMPSWKKKLSDDQIKLIIGYISKWQKP